MVPTKRYQEDGYRDILLSCFPFLKDVSKKREFVSVYQKDGAIPISHVAGMFGITRQAVENACGEDLVEGNEDDKRVKKLVPEAGFRKVMETLAWLAHDQRDYLVSVLYHGGQVMSLGNDEPEELFEGLPNLQNDEDEVHQEHESVKVNVSASSSGGGSGRKKSRVQQHTDDKPFFPQPIFEAVLMDKFRKILQRVEERIAMQELPSITKEVEEEEAQKQDIFQLGSVADRILK